MKVQLKREKGAQQFIPCSGIIASGNDFSQVQVITPLKNIPIYSLPSRLPINCIYSLESPTEVVIRQLEGSQPSSFLTIYGPVNNKINYVVNYAGYHESFAHTRQITFRGRDYPHSYPTGSGYDRGHGIDLADTIAQIHNSNHDPLNYVPQGPDYNQKLRRLFVAHIRQNNGDYR